MLAEAAESVVCAVKMVRQTQWAEWMNRKQMDLTERISYQPP